MKKLLLQSLGIVSFLLVYNTNNVNAQITITPSQTAQDLAQMLVGQGVIMINPTLVCPTVANGKFSFGTNVSDIGIDSGIVLTSGAVINTPGMWGQSYGISNPASLSADMSNNTAGDADLTTLINSNAPAGSYPVGTNDACILSFDFVPAGDTIKFDYVFASDEYTTYNCSINDVFGFFISGPTYPTPQNIALVPGTTNVMVGISTVNDGTGAYGNDACSYNTFGHGAYTQYYNSNAGGANIVYNGFTDVFTAVAAVIPCDTYHLKLAIADASDYILDSGVFLKAGSLNSIGISLDPVSTEGGNSTEPHCIRGCKPGEIEFNRPTAAPLPLTIHYLIEGTAQNGADYEQITDSIVIPANQSKAILNINGLLRSAQGPKTVIIKALSPYLCGNGEIQVIDSATVTIYDSLYAKIITPPTTVCPYDEVTITGEIDPTLTYEWSPAPLIPDNPPFGLTIHPKPTFTTTFTLTATMPGAPATCPPAVKTYIANVEPFPVIQLTKDTTVCLIDSVDLNVYVSPEDINYNYLWTPANHLRDDNSLINKFYAAPGDYSYTFKATTALAGCSSSETMNIHVVPPFTFNSVSPVDTTINYGDKIQLTSESEAIYWLWDPPTFLDDATIKSPIASPKNSIQYTLLGINKYGCKDSAKLNIDVVYDSKSVMPNAFTPNGDGLNDVFKIEGIEYEKVNAFKIFNRYGQLVFETTNGKKGWDGTMNGKIAPAGVYYYYISLALPLGGTKNFKGDVSLIR